LRNRGPQRVRGPADAARSEQLLSQNALLQQQLAEAGFSATLTCARATMLCHNPCNP
jgi:hypothetical protein